MNTSLWFGQEWEIALSGTDRDGKRVPIPVLLDQFKDILINKVKHVDCQKKGWWLDSGGKFYRDIGLHGVDHHEYASPECSHPDELLRHDMAAERLMLGLADCLVSQGELQDVRVSKATVSIASRKSWGSHENYEAGLPVPERPMLAWLASRIALTGSGGLDGRYPGIRFTISPRAHYIETPVNIQTEHDRGLHNLGKAQPHGSKHRVHVVAGDGNRAPLSTWLRFASTALAVRLMDTGHHPDIDLPNVVRALHDFALDPNLNYSIKTSSGTPASMLGIQRAFLEAAQNNMCDFPDWAPRAIQEWQRVLVTLESEQGWRALVGQLDWATKRALFDKVLAARGWTWERVHEVNQMVEHSLIGHLSEAPEQYDHTQHYYYSGELKVLDLVAEQFGENLIKDFEKLRQELAVVDARYMELGKDSLYDQVARPVPVLKKFAPDLPQSHLSLPLPETGRAKVRAELIRKHGWTGDAKKGRKRRTLAWWTHFSTKTKYLPMPEVSGVEDLTWRELPLDSDRQLFGGPLNLDHQRHRPTLGRRTQSAISLSVDAVHQGNRACDSGRYARCHEVLERARQSISSDDVQHHTRIQFWRVMVRIHARQQRGMNIPAALEELAAVDTDKLEQLWEACNARCLLGLAGNDHVPELAQSVKNKMAKRSRVRPSGIACWKSHFGYWLVRQCRPKEALELLEATKDNGEYEATSRSVQIRINTQLAEAHRMLGNYEDAGKLLENAAQSCKRGHFSAHKFDFVLTGQAKLLAEQGDSTAAGRLILEKVLPEQRKRKMPNSIRSLLLLSRLLPDQSEHLTKEEASAFIFNQAMQFGDLNSCPRLMKILNHWTEWCDGKKDPCLPEGAELNDALWGL